MNSKNGYHIVIKRAFDPSRFKQIDNVEFTLDIDDPEKDGYIFDGWSTTENGSAGLIAAGSTVTAYRGTGSLSQTYYAPHYTDKCALIPCELKRNRT